MAEEPHILLVDDEREIREPLAHYLSRNGVRVTKAENAAAARQLLSAYAIDLVLLDIMMPGEDGLALAGFIRATTTIPVILLTAKDRGDGSRRRPRDRRRRLCHQAVQPARIARPDQGGAAPRRREPAVRAPDADTYGFGPWLLKSGERELVGEDNVAIPLSTGEYNLLHAFVTHPRRVLSRDQLLDLSQGRELAAFERSIDNHISRLRKKIEADPANPKLIKTVWGGGYMLAAEVKTAVRRVPSRRA